VTFRVLLDDQAQRDFEEIEAYLDANAPDQTTRFLEDFEAAITVIAEHPLLRHEVRPGVRHETLSVFRYHLWYRVLPEIEHAEVFAMLHHSRGPNALEERL
jgi:plasmid stabilization system protein ParE